MPTPNKPKEFYHSLAKTHGATSSVIPDTGSVMPPEEQRIEHAVDARYVKAAPYQDAISSVGKNEPHEIQINDPSRFSLDPVQTKSHELIHLAMNQLAGPLRNAIPKDDPKKPYYISNIDDLRKKGLKLWQLPQEQAATILQTYTADPSQRKRLQEWVNDLNNMPLSVMNPTSPNQKGINTTIRPPVPPIEGYERLKDIKAKAQELHNHFVKSGYAQPSKDIPLPSQPKDALNKYANPEQQPPKVSFEFNKGWSKPGPYATKLIPTEEQEFRQWAAKNPNSIRGEVGPAPKFEPIPTADYDVRGHFHAAKTGDPAATLTPNKWDGKIHGNDRFKTPYNGGFSNESMYALPHAPRWVGNRLMTHDGKLVTDETPRKPGGQK